MNEAAADSTISAEFYLRLKNFIGRRVSNTEDAEEIVQDVYLRLVKNNKVVASEKVTSWLFVTARNAIADFYRNSGRRTKATALVDIGQDMNKTEQGQISSCLIPLMNRLSQKEADLLDHIDMKGESQKAYAERNGLNYSTLKSKIQRARLKLKKVLLNCCQFTLNSQGVPIEITGGGDCC